MPCKLKFVSCNVLVCCTDRPFSISTQPKLLSGYKIRPYKRDALYVMLNDFHGMSCHVTHVIRSSWDIQSAVVQDGSTFKGQFSNFSRQDMKL